MVGKFVVGHLTVERKDHVLGGHGDTVAPLRGRVHLDLQHGEVGRGVFHAGGQPRNIIVLENAEIHQRFPHEDVAFLMGIARHGPRVGHAYRRGHRPAKDQLRVARQIGKRRCRYNFGRRVLGKYHRRHAANSQSARCCGHHELPTVHHIHRGRYPVLI